MNWKRLREKVLEKHYPEEEELEEARELYRKIADYIEKDLFVEDKLELSMEKVERMLHVLRENARLKAENRALWNGIEQGVKLGEQLGLF